MMPRALLLIVATILFAAGCSPNPSGTQPSGIPVVSLEELKAAPEEIVADGHRYRVEVDVWRDFMPSIPPGGAPVYAVARLVEADSLAIPSGVDLGHLWVVKGEEFAGVRFDEPEQAGWPPHMEVRRAADLPQWGPHIDVDIVVGVTRSAGGFELLASRDVWVERTD